ncbi:hypothetical protein EYC84_000763 [Monilinia fructicola]|uniref:N-acetyltransferase domain-containing protein n=1 Tax=Monilinia fructicola TaxID=38448 RepID=A0A5M9JL25_MONFR|nr:hypothetical protein EYC84_000763 [Monilinia fructicola]
MIIALDILAVDPAYQRRGAGRLLVRWGTAIADELGYMAIVEASEAGRPLGEFCMDGEASKKIGLNRY